MVSFLIGRRPTPQLRERISQTALPVKLTEAKRGSHAVRVKLFGTARPEKSYELHAPFSGTVAPLKNHVEGDFVSAGDIIYQMSTTSIDFSLGQMESQLEMLRLEEERLQENSAFFQSRLETLGALTAYNQQSIEIQEARRNIEAELFESKKKLREKETISQTSFLKADSSFRQIELSLLSNKTTLENNRERHHLLRQELRKNDFAIKKLSLDARELQYKMADLLNDRQKAFIALESDTRMVKAHVESEQEVPAGTKLATLRSTKTVLIPVALPDNYFRWLYEGDLLEGGQPEIDIRLVNRGFEQHFMGGTVRSIGSDLSPETRSLSVVISRDNPVDEHSQLLAEEELRPGTYCEVIFELCRVADTYFIPHSALQENRRLFTVRDSKLHIVKEVELLHESNEGLLIRLPHEEGDLQVVTHVMRGVEEGMAVKVEP